MYHNRINEFILYIITLYFLYMIHNNIQYKYVNINIKDAV